MSHEYAIVLINEEIKKINKDSIELSINLDSTKEALLESIKVLERESLAIETKKAD